MYPLRVEINEENILKLQKVYKAAQLEIEKEITGATDFGVANRKAILAQIDAILEELAAQTDEFIQKELPLYYENGAAIANRQLKNVGAPVNLKEGFNRIHKEAVAAIVDETSRAFAESLTGITRNANTLLGKYVREQITQRMAKGIIGGEALKDVKNGIKSVIQEQGVTMFIDRGGKSWSLDRYTEMLFRTKAVEARNRGLANRMAEYEYDLVQVSDHLGECELCRPWEGRILSVTGATKGYPTVAEAEANGLFHPNCRHAINALIPSLAKETRAYYPEEKTRVISKAEIEKATKLGRPSLPK